MKLTPNYDTFNIKQAIEKAIQLFGKAVFGERVTILPYPETLCPFIIGDKQWLQENIMCLVSNAVKYCPAGQITVGTFIRPAVATHAPSATTPPEMLVFEIEDHGIGISEEKQRELFAPFSQAQRHAGGTGLGLFSLRQRVEALGGGFGVKNRNDGSPGALFWFSFPYRPDYNTAQDMITAETKAMNDRAMTRSAVSPAHSVISMISSLSDQDKEKDPYPGVDIEAPSVTTKPSNQTRRMIKILLADDSVFVRKMMNRVLEQAGYSVTQAENGLEALKALESRGQFDVLVIDLHMPILDGLETIRRIRNKEGGIDRVMSLETAETRRDTDDLLVNRLGLHQVGPLMTLFCPLRTEMIAFYLSPRKISSLSGAPRMEMKQLLEKPLKLVQMALLSNPLLLKRLIKS